MARIALAAALLLALAIPAGAAPHAASAAKPTLCAKATKNLRTAKSRLKKAQRKVKLGKASRATVARARRAVRKAQRAQRSACRAPAHPATPPAPPTQPAPGAPSMPTPPPPPPTPPTSHALIQKALDEGRIDAETALRYKVFAEFGDPRLPSEFRGSALGVTDTRTLDEVTARWDQLSAATRSTPPSRPCATSATPTASRRRGSSSRSRGSIRARGSTGSSSGACPGAPPWMRTSSLPATSSRSRWPSPTSRRNTTTSESARP